jgi:hypothetical protein
VKWFIAERGRFFLRNLSALILWVGRSLQGIWWDWIGVLFYELLRGDSKAFFCDDFMLVLRVAKWFTAELMLIKRTLGFSPRFLKLRDEKG